MTVRLLRFLLVVLALGIQTMAQKASSSPKKPAVRSASVAKPIYSTTAFAGAIPAHFQGNDLKAILDDLLKLDEPKSEFETTADYEARKRLGRATLNAGIALDASLAFVLPTDSWLSSMTTPDVRSEYDADLGVYTVTLQLKDVADTEMMSSWTKKFIGVATWGQTKLGESDYIASNAFGAKTEVHLVRSRTDSVVLPLPARTRPDQSMMAADNPIKVFFSMPLGKAREVKDRLRVLIVCKIGAGSQTHIGINVHEPTFNEPWATSSENHYLEVQPQELWVFDAASGEVFLRSTDAFSSTPTFTHTVTLPH